MKKHVPQINWGQYHSLKGRMHELETKYKTNNNGVWRMKSLNLGMEEIHMTPKVQDDIPRGQALLNELVEDCYDVMRRIQLQEPNHSSTNMSMNVKKPTNEEKNAGDKLEEKSNLQSSGKSKLPPDAQIMMNHKEAF